jgi:hypothetical protein
MRNNLRDVVEQVIVVAVICIVLKAFLILFNLMT